MRVLVTGHEGYLGSVLVADGCRRPATRSSVWTSGLFADCVLGPAPEPVPTLRVDLRDVTREHVAAVRPDAVVHLAALCNDPLGNLNPDLTYDGQPPGHGAAGRAAKAAGVTRFLFASSCSLYGAGPDGIPLDESAPFAPLTPYGESKILAERGLAELADDDFSPVFLRNATAYGFSPRLRGDLVVNDLVGHALFTGKVRLLSDGVGLAPAGARGGHRGRLPARCWRSPASGCTPGRSTSGRRARTTASARSPQVVGELVGGTGHARPPARWPTARDYRVSCESVAREIPEFRPQWTVAKGVEQLAEAYQRYDLSLADADRRAAPAGPADPRPAGLRPARRAAAVAGATGVDVSVVRPDELGPDELRRWRGFQRADATLGNPFLAPEFALAVARHQPTARVAVAARGHRGGRLPALRGARAGDRQGHRQRHLGLPGAWCTGPGWTGTPAG